MASKVENSVDIDRPVSEVFAFVDDYRNTTRYIIGMTQYRPTTDQTSGKGSRFDMVKKTTGLPDIKSEVEVHDWEKDRKIAFRSIRGFENSGSYTFTARGDRTNVKLVNVYDLTSLIGGGGGLFGGLKKAAGGALSKAAEGQARKDLTGSLDKLRQLVEATPRKAAPATRSVARAAAKPASAAAEKPAARKPPAGKEATGKAPAGKPSTSKAATGKAAPASGSARKAAAGKATSRGSKPAGK
jgi:uncharacterized protein YndB with AHSA1/START domain